MSLSALLRSRFCECAGSAAVTVPGSCQVKEASNKALEVAKTEEDGVDAINYMSYVDWMMGDGNGAGK